MRLSALLVLLVLAAGCNRDKVDSRNDPPMESTTQGAADTAVSDTATTTTAPSDTSTTTRPAETAHPPSNTTT